MALDSSDSEDDVLPTKVNVWDGCAVKNAMDDAVKHMLINEFGLVEDFKLMDIRLAISVCAVFIAFFALIYDYIYPFPASRPVLLYSVIWYFILMFILSCYMVFAEKGLFFLAKEHAGDGINYNVWGAISELPQHSDQYKLTLTKKVDKENSKETVLEQSVAKFFTKDGGLVKRNVREMLEKMCGILEKNKDE